MSQLSRRKEGGEEPQQQASPDVEVQVVEETDDQEVQIDMVRRAGAVAFVLEMALLVAVCKVFSINSLLAFTYPGASVPDNHLDITRVQLVLLDAAPKAVAVDLAVACAVSIWIAMGRPPLAMIRTAAVLWALATVFDSASVVATGGPLQLGLVLLTMEHPLPALKQVWRETMARSTPTGLLAVCAAGVCARLVHMRVRRLLLKTIRRIRRAATSTRKVLAAVAVLLAGTSLTVSVSLSDPSISHAFVKPVPYRWAMEFFDSSGGAVDPSYNADQDAAAVLADAAPRTPLQGLNESMIVVVFEAARSDSWTMYPPHLYGTTPFLSTLASHPGAKTYTGVFPTLVNSNKALIEILCGRIPMVATTWKDVDAVAAHGCMPMRISRDTGVETVFAGKDSSPDTIQQLAGFDVYISGTTDAVVFSNVLVYLRRAPPKKRFLMVIETTDTHFPYQEGTKEWLKARPNFPPKAPKMSQDDALKAVQKCVFPANASCWGYRSKRSVLSPGTLKDYYLQAVRLTDQNIFRLARYVATRPLTGVNLLVVGDHGEAFGEQGHRQHGSCVYLQCARVPMITFPLDALRSPRFFPPPEVHRSLRSLADVGATIGATFGLVDPTKPSPWWRGTPLQSADPPRTSLFTYAFFNTRSFAKHTPSTSFAFDPLYGTLAASLETGQELAEAPAGTAKGAARKEAASLALRTTLLYNALQEKAGGGKVAEGSVMLQPYALQAARGAAMRVCAGTVFCPTVQLTATLRCLTGTQFRLERCDSKGDLYRFRISAKFLAPEESCGNNGTCSAVIRVKPYCWELQPSPEAAYSIHIKAPDVGLYLGTVDTDPIMGCDRSMVYTDVPGGECPSECSAVASQQECVRGSDRLGMTRYLNRADPPPPPPGVKKTEAPWVFPQPYQQADLPKGCSIDTAAGFVYFNTRTRKEDVAYGTRFHRMCQCNQTNASKATEDVLAPRVAAPVRGKICPSKAVIGLVRMVDEYHCRGTCFRSPKCVAFSLQGARDNGTCLMYRSCTMYETPTEEATSWKVKRAPLKPEIQLGWGRSPPPSWILRRCNGKALEYLR